MSRTLAFAVWAAALCALPAAAEEMPARPACATTSDAGLPPALAGWTARTPLPAATTAAGAGKASLPLGKGVDAQLKPNGDVAFPAAPGKPGGPASYGGLYEIAVSAPGDYQVSLGAGAWIEVVSGGALLQAADHAPGVACTSLKKLVVFSLKPGRYLLEIAGNAQPVLPVMVSRRP